MKTVTAFAALLAVAACAQGEVVLTDDPNAPSEEGTILFGADTSDPAPAPVTELPPELPDGISLDF